MTHLSAIVPVSRHIPLEAVLRRASRMAQQMFDKDGEVTMFWLVETGAGEQLTLITPVMGPPGVSGTEVKDALIAKVRGFFQKHDVKRYANASECWTADRPEDDPHRREVVFIEAVDGREHLVAMRDIVRLHGGQPYLAKLGQIERPRRLGGRFLDLLPRPGRIRSGNELADDEGEVFVAMTPGIPILVIGRRDPRTGELCVGRVYPRPEEAKALNYADCPGEILTGTEAEGLVRAVYERLIEQARREGLTVEQLISRRRWGQ
jgi:hypothetical protein